MPTEIQLLRITPSNDTLLQSSLLKGDIELKLNGFSTETLLEMWDPEKKIYLVRILYENKDWIINK